MVEKLYKKLYSPLTDSIGDIIEGDKRKPQPLPVVETPVITITDTTATITCVTDGATIYYTLDGSTPTSESTTYSSAITLTQSCTIKAIAVKLGMTDSEVASEDYTNPETIYAYGVQWDVKDSNPDVTRIGNMALHASLPVQSQMRGCLLDDDGKVTKYLTQEDWNQTTLGDETHQVMIELPDFWYKFVKNGDTRTVMISAVNLNGYTKFKKLYVSAYEATVDRGNTATSGGETDKSQWQLASVKSNATKFRGGNNNASKDSAYNTQLQTAATNISCTEYRTFARRRKSNSTEWNQYTYLIHRMLYWLFVIEYATRNSQKAVNNNLTTEGYKQGGLGNGATTVNGNDWNRLFSSYPFIPIGTSDSLGNGSGEVSYTSTDNNNTTWTTVKVCRYRGIENPFGHIWKLTDGIHVQVESGENGESKVYVTDDPSLWQDSNNNNYNYIGNETRVNSYVKDILDDGNIMCSDDQTSSNQYYCDYHYTNIPSSGSSLRAVRFGGTANDGASAGFVYSNTFLAPSTRYAIVGSRLCFVPNN